MKDMELEADSHDESQEQKVSVNKSKLVLAVTTRLNSAQVRRVLILSSHCQRAVVCTDHYGLGPHKARQQAPGHLQQPWFVCRSTECPKSL